MKKETIAPFNWEQEEQDTLEPKMNLVIYRDDYAYPIYANSFKEMQKVRNEANHSFISHGYDSIAYDCISKKYYNIETGEEVPSSKRGW